MTLSRRRFLRLSALAAAPALTPSIAGCREAADGRSSNQVVVIGAGLAGLSAAGVLHKAGRDVVVLEARSVAGGRVRTIRAPFADGLYAEAGAIRIAGSHQIVLRLVREFGLNLVPFDSSNGSPLMTIGTKSVRTDDLGRVRLPLDLTSSERGKSQGMLLETYVGDLSDELADPEPRPESYARWAPYDQVTWHEWLRGRGASDGAIALMTLGGDSSELSALYVLRQFALLRSVSQFYKLQGGMDLLPRAMASALGDRIRYDAAVVRVDQSAGGVEVEYAQGGRSKSVQADRVVVAIPLSTLRHVDVRPPFSAEKARTIETLPYYPATRFLLESRNRFWHAEGLSGYARTDQPAEIWDCTYDQPASPGVLGATVGGPPGRAVLDMSETQAVAFGRDLVSRTFPALGREFSTGAAYRWALDPWSRGAFAVFHPGQMTAMMPGIARPEGRVHFAGEHTSAWMGWMEGALASGERAAQEILNA